MLRMRRMVKNKLVADQASICVTLTSTAFLEAVYQSIQKLTVKTISSYR